MKSTSLNSKSIITKYKPKIAVQRLQHDHSIAYNLTGSISLGSLL